MNEPKRLLLGEASERERALLQAAAAEEPAADAALRFAASLGLPSLEPAPTPKDGAATQPRSQAPRGKLAPHKTAATKLASSKLVVKWLALTGAGMMAISSTWLVSKPESAPPRSAAAEKRAAPVAPETTEPARAPDQSDSVVARIEQASESVPSQSGSIAAEIRELERVRTLLRANQSARALRELGGYDARYPRGALREEADFMRIEASTRAERREEARQSAARFLETHPRSIHAARVRQLLESLDAR